MNIAREAQTATLLPEGMVLVAGGYNSSLIEVISCELYYPNTGKWSITGSMTNAREGQTATLLPDGMVLVAGYGTTINGIQPNSCELYDSRNGYMVHYG